MLRLTNAFSLGRRQSEECAGTVLALCSTPARARLWAECLAVHSCVGIWDPPSPHDATSFVVTSPVYVGMDPFEIISEPQREAGGLQGPSGLGLCEDTFSNFKV